MVCRHAHHTCFTGCVEQLWCVWILLLQELADVKGLIQSLVATVKRWYLQNCCYHALRDPGTRLV